jgi:hypothetical protein
MGRVLPREDWKPRLTGMEGLLIGSTLGMYVASFCDDHRHVHLLRSWWLLHESSCDHGKDSWVSQVLLEADLTQVNLIVLLIVSSISVHPTIQSTTLKLG